MSAGSAALDANGGKRPRELAALFESSEAVMREKSRDRAPCRPCYTPRATFDVPPYPAERYQAGDRTRSAGKALDGQFDL